MATKHLDHWKFHRRYGTYTLVPLLLRRVHVSLEAPMNPKSTAQIAGHPIHPMLIPFPIAFFVGTFACDLVYWQTHNPAWAQPTLWLLGAGLVMAALAAVMGVIDVLGDVQIKQLSTAWWHAGANVLVVLVELYNLFVRYQYGDVAIVPNGLVLSLVAVLLLLFSGWKGGDLVFRGRIGVEG
jgi:uncharacterized membrane protein